MPATSTALKSLEAEADQEIASSDPLGPLGNIVGTLLLKGFPWSRIASWFDARGVSLPAGVWQSRFGYLRLFPITVSMSSETMLDDIAGETECFIVADESSPEANERLSMIETPAHIISSSALLQIQLLEGASGHHSLESVGNVRQMPSVASR